MHAPTRTHTHNVLKRNINPTEMKVGIKTLKSLKDGRVLTEVGSIVETSSLSNSIREKYGEALEVPQLRKPRLIIRNIPQDIQVENLEETFTSSKSRTEHQTGGGGGVSKPN
jgi:hypothetical protein